MMNWPMLLDAAALARQKAGRSRLGRNWRSSRSLPWMDKSTQRSVCNARVSLAMRFMETATGESI